MVARRTTARIALLVALPIALAACGGGGSGPLPGNPGSVTDQGSSRGGVAVTDGSIDHGDPAATGVAVAGGPAPGSGDVLARYGGPTVVEPAAAHEPAEIHIPKLDVHSQLLRLGLNPDRSLEVPGNFNLAGWYVNSPPPGAPGPAVIAGHVDSRRGPAIFYDLGDLSAGDQIHVIRGDGTKVEFEVDRLEHYPKDSFPTDEVYGDTSQPQLRLITCSGRFDRGQRHYEDNLVVYASLVGTPPPGPAPSASPAESPPGSDPESPSESPGGQTQEPTPAPGSSEPPGSDPEEPEELEEDFDPWAEPTQEPTPEDA